MKDRIRQIMDSQSMSQQVFADFLGVGAATLSSIFNGRTRPTINIVEAIKKKIPNINTDWLMFGSGDMFQSENSPQFTENEGAETPPLIQNPMLDFESAASPTPKNAPSAAQNFNSVKNTRSENVLGEVKVVDKPQRRITEIRIFYDDQTWETFVPQKK
jgi:transcriptional regulator with XRE-family HTH domain